MLPILNEPMLLRVIEPHLKYVDKVIIAAGYLVDAIKKFFEKKPLDKDIIIVKDEKPLGTGGALKNVEDYIEGRFFACNGDVITSLNIKKMLNFHKKSGSIATISSWEVDDVTHYGVLEIENSRVKRFVEKPNPWDAPSKMINAGFYLFEKEILEDIPKDAEISLEKEIFPKIIDKGVSHYPIKGYWVDAGKRETYILAHNLLMDAKNIRIVHGQMCNLKEAKIVEPVYIGNDVIINRECEIGPYVCIGDNVLIEDGCTISNTVIHSNSVICSGSFIEKSIIGSFVEVKGRISKEIVGV